MEYMGEREWVDRGAVKSCTQGLHAHDNWWDRPPSIGSTIRLLLEQEVWTTSFCATWAPIA